MAPWKDSPPAPPGSVAAGGTAEDMADAIAAARSAFDDTEWCPDVALRVHCLRQLREASSPR